MHRNHEINNFMHVIYDMLDMVAAAHYQEVKL
jgi:hypothetical protein